MDVIKSSTIACTWGYGGAKGAKTLTTFQHIALLLTIVWLLLVIVRFRRSRLVLICGLVAIGLYTVVALILGKVTPEELGLGIPYSWVPTIFLSLVWLDPAHKAYLS